MVYPESFQRMIASHDNKIQRFLSPENTPHSFAFLGKPDNPESRPISSYPNDAVFGAGESLGSIVMAVKGGASPGFTLPPETHGRALETRSIGRIFEFLKPCLDVLVKEFSPGKWKCCGKSNDLSTKHEGEDDEKTRVY